MCENLGPVAAAVYMEYNRQNKLSNISQVCPFRICPIFVKTRSFIMWRNSPFPKYTRWNLGRARASANCYFLYLCISVI